MEMVPVRVAAATVRSASVVNVAPMRFKGVVALAAAPNPNLANWGVDEV